MTEIHRIREQLRNAIDGPAWHGPALRPLLADLDAAGAANRPLREVHTPWEIVLHILAWLETAGLRLKGQKGEMTPATDWPTVNDTSAAAWSELREQVASVHEDLQSLLENMTDEDLAEPVAGQEYRKNFMLHGVVQHTLYHAGQIAILKKSSRPSRGTD